MGIVNTMSAAAFVPRGSSTESLPVQPSFTDSVSGMSALSGEEQQHLNEGRAPPSQSSTDDLRCGLFSMTPMLASRPGKQVAACCYSGIRCCFFTSELAWQLQAGMRLVNMHVLGKNHAWQSYTSKTDKKTCKNAPQLSAEPKVGFCTVLTATTQDVVLSILCVQCALL